MPLFLGRFSYAPEAIRALVAHPSDRRQAADEVARSLGVTLHGFWWAFGEFDGVFISEAPDNATATALALRIGGSGAFSRVETTVLLDMDEAAEAMRKAAGATYQPPS